MAEQAIRWETYKDNAGEFRARFRAGNGEVVFVTSEGYQNEGDLEEAIELLESTIRNTVGNGSYSRLPRLRVEL
jgi:uncharacterized protein YegP (UPF0339 family)